MSGVVTTWLTQRFGLEVPVVSAPMAGVAGGRLAAAVSQAGALGMIGFGGGAPAQLQREVEAARALGRPFGIGLLAWSLPAHPGVFEAALSSGAALISVSYGDLATYVDRIKQAGAVAATQVGTLDDARQAVSLGFDLGVARGGEGGGHGRDAVATLPLLSAVLDEVDVPVLAAGGVATARGLAAVLAAGAAGAWVGTPFVATLEADNDAAARDAVVAADLTDTVYTTVLDVGRGSAWPKEYGGRALRNAYATRWHGREAELEVARVRIDEPIVWAGQGAGLVRTVRPAADVVADLARAGDLLLEAAARVR